MYFLFIEPYRNNVFVPYKRKGSGDGGSPSVPVIASSDSFMERRREVTRARRGSLSIDIDKLTDENEVRNYLFQHDFYFYFYLFIYLLFYNKILFYYFPFLSRSTILLLFLISMSMSFHLRRTVVLPRVALILSADTL